MRKAIQYYRRYLNFDEKVLLLLVLSRFCSVWRLFEARILVIAIPLKTKAWYLQDHMNEKSNYPNRTVNPLAFVKTPINTVFSIRYIKR